MRREILVVLTFSLAACAANWIGHGFRKRIEELGSYRNYIPAPFFDEGENLSSQNCGNEANPKQCIVSVRNMGWSDRFCDSYIAISHTAVLGIGYCPSYEKSDATNLRVFPNNCAGRETEEECIKMSTKVLDVIDITTGPIKKFNFPILITEKMPSEVVNPICLFNRDNVLDQQLQIESPYFEWSSSNDNPPIRRNLTSTIDCLSLSEEQYQEFRGAGTNILITIIFREYINGIPCFEENLFRTYRYLVNFYKGRYFLRGLKYSWGEGFYIDILTYIEEIARHANDISVLPLIPTTKQPMRFNASDNLSFPNCGSKQQTSTRNKRGNEDSPKDFQAIIDGNIARTGEHPWHAHIESYRTRATCGGTLISPTVVLTAAHCIYRSKAIDFIVAVGMYDKRERGAPGVQRRLVSTLITHKNYDPVETHSDVGLMILSDKIEITDHVRPICLWNEDSNLARLAGTEAMAVGFGLFDNHTNQSELQQARLPIRDHEECYLSGRKFFEKYLCPGDNFCAGYTNGTTVCNGDSGGSLSVEKDGRWFIRGIVSFGKSKKVMFEGNETSLCHPNQYSLFVDVASYMDWIVEKTPEISFRN